MANLDLDRGLRTAVTPGSDVVILILAEHPVLTGKANGLVDAVIGHQRTGVVADDVAGHAAVVMKGLPNAAEPGFLRLMFVCLDKDAA